MSQPSQLENVRQTRRLAHPARLNNPPALLKPCSSGIPFWTSCCWVTFQVIVLMLMALALLVFPQLALFLPDLLT